MVSFEKATSLRSLLSPAYLSTQVELPIEKPGDFLIPRSDDQNGFISEDLHWGCTYNMDVVRCFPIIEPQPSFRKVCKTTYSMPSQSFKFRPYKNRKIIITSAAELSLDNQRLTRGMKYILLGLDMEEIGALVVYDPLKAKPIKFIILPHPVTSVNVVSHFEDNVMNNFFNPAMIAMVGIAAVGLKGGDTLIIDLGLDDPEMSPYAKKSDEVKHCKLKFVKTKELQIAQKRKRFAAKGYNIALLINYNHERESMYQFVDPDDSHSYESPKYPAVVTAVQYVPEIGSLIIGFNFGSFQIYRIDELTLEYTGPVNEDVPVMSFAFRQPIDDPKNFCYLWVFYGFDHYNADQAFAELFAMFFDIKRTDEHHGTIYENLKKTQKRLGIQLKDFHYEDEEDCVVRPIRMWNHGDNLTFFAWESNRTGSYYIGIFDLNQWYSTETPSDLRINPLNGLCPYWVAILVHSKARRSRLWDIRLKPKTFQKWFMPHLDSELHPYPSSFTFQGLCLNDSGTFSFEYYGIQERLLQIIVKDGHSLLTEPAELVHACKKYGLQPVYTEMYQHESISPDDQDRYFIFSTLLDCRRLTHITCIADKWMDGSFANAGCTIDLIIDWIKHAISTIQSYSETHWFNLFNSRSEILPPESANYISYSFVSWNDLKGLLHILLKPKESFSLRRKIMDESTYIVNKLVLYSRALLMVYQAKILPTTDFEAMRAIKTFYKSRRKEIGNTLIKAEFLENEFKKQPRLMIDYLVENLTEVEWDFPPEMSPLEPKYPPVHPAHVLNMLMNHGVTPEGEKAIARVVYYFFLDLVHLGRISQINIKGHLGTLLNLSSIEKDEVYHLWSFDQGNYDSVSSYLSKRSDLDEKDRLPWFTLIAFLSTIDDQQHRMLKILKKSCPPKLAKLYINLSLAKGCRDYVFDSDFYSTISRNSELLRHLFQEIESKGVLRNFILQNGKNLGELGNSILISQLKKSFSFDGHDLLFLFHILTKNQRAAVELEDKMKTEWNSLNLTPKEQEMFKSKQKMLSQLIKDRNENNPLIHLLRKEPVCETGKQPKIPKFKIPVNQIPSTPVNRSTILSRFKAIAKPVAYSPLRHFTGFKTTEFEEEEELGEGSMEEDYSINGTSQIQLYDVASILQTPRVRNLDESSPSSKAQQQQPDSTKIHSIIKLSDSRTSTPRHIQKIKFNLIDEEEGLDSSSDLRKEAEDPSEDSSDLIIPDDDESMDLVIEKDESVEEEEEEEKVREVPVPFDDESIEAGPFIANMSDSLERTRSRDAMNDSSIEISILPEIQSPIQSFTPFAQFSPLRPSSPSKAIKSSSEKIGSPSKVIVEDEIVAVNEDSNLERVEIEEEIQIPQTEPIVEQMDLETSSGTSLIKETPVPDAEPTVEPAVIDQNLPTSIEENVEKEEKEMEEPPTEDLEKSHSQRQNPVIFDHTMGFELSLDASLGDLEETQESFRAGQLSRDLNERVYDTRRIIDAFTSISKEVTKESSKVQPEEIPEEAMAEPKGRKRKGSAKDSHGKIHKPTMVVPEDKFELSLDVSYNLDQISTTASEGKNEEANLPEMSFVTRSGKRRTPVPEPRPTPTEKKTSKKTKKAASESPEGLEKYQMPDESLVKRKRKAQTPDLENRISSSSRTPLKPKRRTRNATEPTGSSGNNRLFPQPDIPAVPAPIPIEPLANLANEIPSSSTNLETRDEEPTTGKKTKRRTRKDSGDVEVNKGYTRPPSVDPELVGDQTVEKPRKKAKKDEGNKYEASAAEGSKRMRTRSRPDPEPRPSKAQLLEEILPMLAASTKGKKKSKSPSREQEEENENVFDVSPMKDSDDNLFDSQTLDVPVTRRRQVKKMDETSLSQSSFTPTVSERAKKGRKKPEEPPLDFEVFTQESQEEALPERSYSTRARKKTPVPSTMSQSLDSATKSTRKKSTGSPEKQLEENPFNESKKKGKSRKKPTESSETQQPSIEDPPPPIAPKTSRRRKTPEPSSFTSTTTTSTRKTKKKPVELEMEESVDEQSTSSRSRRPSGRSSTESPSPSPSPMKRGGRTRKKSWGVEERESEEDPRESDERVIAEIVKRKGQLRRFNTFNLNLSTVVEVSGCDVPQASEPSLVKNSPLEWHEHECSDVPPQLSPPKVLRSRSVSVQRDEEPEKTEKPSKRTRKAFTEEDASISRRTRAGSVSSNKSSTSKR